MRIPPVWTIIPALTIPVNRPDATPKPKHVAAGIVGPVAAWPKFPTAIAARPLARSGSTP